MGFLNFYLQRMERWILDPKCFLLAKEANLPAGLALKTAFESAAAMDWKGRQRAILNVVKGMSQEDFEKLTKCVDENDEAGLLECMKNVSAKAELIQDKLFNELHTTLPKNKLVLLQKAVLENVFRYNSHSETIDDFKENLIFVRSRASSKKTELSYHSFDDKVIKLPAYWLKDKWFIHLSNLAKDYAHRSYEDVKAVNPKNWVRCLDIMSTPYLCYCVLIRYKDLAGNIQYQIYIGEQGVKPERWKTSGTQHFRSIKLALEGEIHQRQACDLALAYFGSKQSCVFIIGDFDEEKKFSKEFQFPNEEGTHDMRKHTISLSPKGGTDGTISKKGKAKSKTETLTTEKMSKKK